MNLDPLQPAVPAFGYELLRDHVLPSLLGSHEADVLYWAGKELARKFPLLSPAELPDFFLKAGWGVLRLEKTGSASSVFSLDAPLAAASSARRSTRLEAGFLAEQSQRWTGFLTECYDEPESAPGATRFYLKWDVHDPLHP